MGGNYNLSIIFRYASIDGSEDSPVLNPCFVIKNWGSGSNARVRINGKKQASDDNIKQGIIRDTDGTLTLIIWIEQKSNEKVLYEVY